MRDLHLLLTLPDNSPTLSRLAARGNRQGSALAGLSATLDRLFATGGALAPVLLAAEGLAPGPDPWFRADPVHLLAGMHSVSLLDCRHFRLEAGEATLLVEALNRHFGAEAHFVAPHPERWYVRLGRPLDADAPPVDEMAGVPVEPNLVGGADAAHLHRLAMEAQMLLYDHPINDEREARGELPVNALWFWGGGVAGSPVAAFDRVLTDDFSAAALARAAGVVPQPLPERFEPTPGRTLAVLDMAAAPERIEAHWLVPVLAALKWGRLDRLDLEVPGRGGVRVRLGRAQAWRFWAG